MEVGITGYAFASLLQAEDVVGATQSDGIPIFSSQFLEYNKGKHFLSFAFFVRTVSIVAAYVCICSFPPYSVIFLAQPPCYELMHDIMDL